MVRDTAQRVQRIEIPSSVTVIQLAQLLDLAPVDIIKQLMRNNVMANVNQAVDFDVAARVVADLGFRPMPLKDVAGPASLRDVASEEDASQLIERPPVVTVLGHVDHGKTTLLDAVRQTNITATEAGGITQHIGAYQVDYNGKKITFIDTPGHEAFTMMRARGAQITDVVVLVVAADDGVMPQTVEAMDHARAAGVPIVVAINKIDRPDADLDRVKRQLSEHSLLIEEWGGSIVAVPVSATTREGLDDLLENILVVAEIEELKANPNRAARGVIVEAEIDKSRGPIATVLIQSGTLQNGDNVVVNGIRGRVKAMFSGPGQRVKSAGPSVPIELLGLNELPQSGDILVVVSDEKTAREMAEEQRRLQNTGRGRGRGSLEEMYAKIRAGEIKELNLILKTDVQGTVEAIKSSLERLGTEQVIANLIHAASGSVIESDVMLASASEAIIVAFSTRIEPGARRLADQEGVDIRFYDVIYRLIEDVEKALEGLLEPVQKDVTDGRAVVREIFSVGRRIKIAGIFVQDGKIMRNGQIRVLREGDILYDGPTTSLRHFKEDVRELGTGYEGGIRIDGFPDFQEGDILEAHHAEQEPTSS